MNGPIDRLLVRAPNWLGDAVLALPALAAIRRHFRGGHLTIGAPASIAPLFRETSAAAPDAVLELPSSRRAARDAVRTARYDAAILFPNSFRSAWELKRAGVAERWGFARAGRGLLLTRRVRRPPRSGRHQSDYYRELVRGLGIACASDELPAIAASAESLRRAGELLARHRIPADSRLVVLLPGAAYGQAKQWPPDRMADLAARLVGRGDVTCVIAGAPHDRDAARAIESGIRSAAPGALARVVDLVGRTDLSALIGVLARAAVCVSNDSGGMHVASALGRPVVAIFGPTDERATHPTGDHDLIMEPVFCRPCMLRDCPIDHRCMKRITADRVFATVSARLGAQA
jgi:heptosyltransferase-2